MSSRKKISALVRNRNRKTNTKNRTSYQIRLDVVIVVLLSFTVCTVANGKGDTIAENTLSQSNKFSPPLYAENGFKPILPTISNTDDPDTPRFELFTGKGQFKVFADDNHLSDLPIVKFPSKSNNFVALSPEKQNSLPWSRVVNRIEGIPVERAKNSTKSTNSTTTITHSSLPKGQIIEKANETRQNSTVVLYTTTLPNSLGNVFNTKKTQKGVDEKRRKITEIRQLERMLFKYVEDALSNGSYELFSGFSIVPENKTNTRAPTARNTTQTSRRILLSQEEDMDLDSFDEMVTEQFRRFAEAHVINVNLPRAVESGRLFFFKGLKKILWPVFIGVQIAKTILLALFLPSILGSLGKIVGKGITSVSGFNHPSETVHDLDFKDNSYNLDQDNNFNDYTYPQPEASNQNFATQMFDATAMNTNHNNVLSRFGMGDQKVTYVNSGSGLYSNQNSNQNPNMMTKNNFKIFQDIPASSLLLTNYDPFYSPLLSRLDSVFQQLGLGSGDEICREKLVCLMYASPAKYAPYSNLVSAQLSRELNELRKPTSDNADILRFFKYMKSAKDGQDGVNCETAYMHCTGFKESNNPAMLTTYHDINKLVQARKI